MTTDRRDFIKTGATATAVAAVGGLMSSPVHAAGNDKIKIGLVGCGGRGSGAVRDNFAADGQTVLHAVGDVFESKVKSQAEAYKKQHGDRVELGDRIFSGLDAYQKVIDSGVDLVMFATPPGFRPYHLEAAVKAGKHIFTEKPVAVDPFGIQKVLNLAEESQSKNMCIVAGTQRRHSKGYQETIKRIQDGEIGEIVNARAAWNGQGIWFHPRQESMSDVEYQLNNWYHFMWVCGDHIVEQHIHNLDVINWIMGGPPEKAVMVGGGRAYRPEGIPAVAGNIWDHFAIEYTYPNGTPMYSFCAHIPGMKSDVSELVYGTKGNSKVSSNQVGKDWSYKGKGDPSDYVQEHIDLIASIRSGKKINELKQVAESTMTAILGREAGYSGQELTFDGLLKSGRNTMPEGLTLDGKLTTDPVPTPATYKKYRRA